jgi:hypothetical protein
MNYNVMDSIVCPLTGTVFAGIITDRNLKLIIWYQGETIVHAGDILSTAGKGLFVNGVASGIAIITVFPFNPKNWVLLSERTGCPANGAVKPTACTRPDHCRFKCCPYGLVRPVEMAS